MLLPRSDCGFSVKGDCVYPNISSIILSESHQTPSPFSSSSCWSSFTLTAHPRSKSYQQLQNQAEMAFALQPPCRVLRECPPSSSTLNQFPKILLTPGELGHQKVDDTDYSWLQSQLWRGRERTVKELSPSFKN